MANIIFGRLVTKSGDEVPTIPPSPTHDLGDWLKTDIYGFELYLHITSPTTCDLYTRVGDTIVLLSSGATGLSEVSHDTSLTGLGTSGSPLEVNISAQVGNLLSLVGGGDPGLYVGSDSGKQDLSTILTALSALGSVEAGRLIYTSATNTFATDTYRRFTEEALSATITWTGTTAPSGATNHRLGYAVIHKQVFFSVKLNYATAGAALTNMTITNLFGTGAGLLPVPAQWNGWTGASVISQRVAGWLSTNQTSVTASIAAPFFARNAGDTDFELRCSTFNSGAYRYAELTGSYFAA